jgi:esterase/lipase superfamily enzyme
MRTPLLTVALLILLAGCRHDTVLVDTPHVMAGDRGRAVYAHVPGHLRTTDIPVIYFTDRHDRGLDDPVVEGGPAPQPDYGNQRSQDISFGVARVTLSPQRTWDEMVADATATDRGGRIALSVGEVTRTGTIASLEGRLRVVDGEVVYPPEASAAFANDLADFHDTLEPFLTDGPGGNAALVFVHGVNNSFDSGVLRLAQTWHAAGRHAVPIVFSWPAGSHAFKPIAYNHDRESGEYSVLQLKTLLMALAANEDIDRVHIVAHSRGTDVATTALREIANEIHAVEGRTFFGRLTHEALGRTMGSLEPAAVEGVRASDVLKLESLVLVAPDLDMDVFTQRFLSERVMRVARRVVVYTSREDGALGLARLFFASQRRLGDATLEDFDDNSRRLINELPTIEIVECRVGGVSSHAYLFEHPAALSDMILVVRDGLHPQGDGVEAEGASETTSEAVRRGLVPPARPLEMLEPGFYVLDESYLKPGP